MSNDISVNRQAFHNYDIIEKFEAGMVLTGTEIKSARDGRVNLKDAHGLVEDYPGLFRRVTGESAAQA